MRAIYEPTGAAREYAELACNLFRGCTHGCTYCYAPNCLRMNRHDFHFDSSARPGILDAIATDLETSDKSKRVLFCFTTDPYQCERPDLHETTRQAIRLCRDVGQRFSILTKGGTAACDDFWMYQHGLDSQVTGWFGTTLTTDGIDWYKWEPKAASPASRIAAIEQAHEWGIPTWVSIEPVIDPAQALWFIRNLSNIVDLWKVGKLNYHSAASCIDWLQFGLDLAQVFTDVGKPYLIKDSLHRYMPSGFPLDTQREMLVAMGAEDEWQPAASTEWTTASLF